MCPRIVAGSFRQRLTLLLYHRFMAIPVSGITASERTAIRRTPCDQIFSGLGGTNNNEAFKMRSAYIFQEDVEYGQPLPASTTSWRLTSDKHQKKRGTVREDVLAHLYEGRPTGRYVH
ncbi:uncharacterized protein [Dermacentor albipictus]|uniref:uncharacterized protein isoform X2 n=1 Tax=Dermacentor albipictus TaxID=60249 RepID=UPI0038FC3B38